MKRGHDDDEAFEPHSYVDQDRRHGHDGDASRIRSTRTPIGTQTLQKNIDPMPKRTDRSHG